MKIQRIVITNYKAFLGTYKINVGGKNLFIYGENGSGKSSLYYALKDFFQSSIENININALDNVFVPESKKGKTTVKATFKPDNNGHKRNKLYIWDDTQITSREANDTSIRDGNKLKSFLTYKHLLGIHHIKQDDQINMFDMLVKGVLKHFKYTLTNGKELGELWFDVQQEIEKNTGRSYPKPTKQANVKKALKVFNQAFGELFKTGSPEYVLLHARPILEKFNHNIDLDLKFPQLRPNSDYTQIEGDKVQVKIKYCGKEVAKPHLFLNEARLSAIAISIYLGMIKRHVQGIPCKILFLDDIFIGLDIANRLPLLDILKTEFSDYQIFITTYDKPWFEYAQGFLDNNWNTLELYAKSSNDGITIPYIIDDQDLLKKARKHISNCDFKAAAVYTRSAFEKTLSNFCHKDERKVKFHKKREQYTTEDFWLAIKDDLTPACVTNVEIYRALVLNTFSHYNCERHEIKQELENAVLAIKSLKVELSNL